MSLESGTEKEPSISASLHSRGAYYRTHNHRNSEINSASCSDYKYGCCELFDSCRVSYETDNATFVSEGIHIDPRKIHKHDEYGTNCPRFEDMVDDYSRVYGDPNCISTAFGCCDISTVCDIVSYSKQLYNESDNYVISTYHTEMINMEIGVSWTGITKRDESGSNCPSTYDVIHKYQIGFRTVADDVRDMFMIFCMLLFFAFCMNLGSHKRGRRY